MILPDPIERMESVAEAWSEKNIVGDKFLCSCGIWCGLKDGEAISSHPYALPVCPKCFNDFIDEIERINER